MSQLETAVQPVLSRLVNGYPTGFDAISRPALAAWAVKTAMVMEHTLPKEAGIYYLPDERAAFRMPPHEPPPDTFIDIAWYPRGSLMASFRASTIGTTTVTGNNWAPARQCSLIFGQLALRVASNRWKATTGNDYLSWPDKLWGKCVHLWPPNFGGPQEWPVQDFLSNDEASDGW